MSSTDPSPISLVDIPDDPDVATSPVQEVRSALHWYNLGFLSDLAILIILIVVCLVVDQVNNINVNHPIAFSLREAHHGSCVKRSRSKSSASLKHCF